MLTIGITAAGSGVAQAVIDSLRQSSLNCRIVGFEASSWAKGAYECDAVYLLPPASDHAYQHELLRRCRETGIQVLIPGLDLELVPIAEIASLLEENGCRPILSSLECVRICRDKLALHRYLASRRAPFVMTWSLSEALSQADSLPYPVLLKPRQGSGSTNIRIICSVHDWEDVEDEDQWVVQPYLISKDWEQTVLNRLYLFKQPIQEDELSVQVMVSNEGGVIGRFASLNRLKAGIPVHVNPIDEPGIWPAVEAMISALLPLGLRGPCNLQGRITPEGVFFFEVNPRFTGITHQRALMGYNEVEASVRHFAMGESAAETARRLQPSLKYVGLRQMTEIVVSRERLARLEQSRALETGIPLSRALITGTSGYVGYALAHALLSQGIVQEIIAPVRNIAKASAQWLGDPLAARMRWLCWDLAEPPPCFEGVEAAILVAAVRDTSAFESGFEANTTGTLNAVVAARRLCISRLIFVSSQSVYGLKQPPPWVEDGVVAPETPYAFSKVAGEAITRTLSNSSTRWAILRLARLYGLSPNMRWEELPHRFAAWAAAGKALPIHGDGWQEMDLLHVRDAVRSIIRLIQQPCSCWNQTYNVGSGCPVSVYELAVSCVSLSTDLGISHPSIVFIPDSKPKPNSGMDIAAARQLLGWNPEISLSTGLTELIHYAWNSHQLPVETS